MPPWLSIGCFQVNKLNIMTRKSIYDQVICRPALPLDTPGMLELTRKIWDGDDYVPKTWHDWLNDHQGLLAVAELRGRVVGIGKLTKLSQDDWWLEGLRVHPQFEGRRIASRIHTYLLQSWEKLGSGTVRFATVSSREPVKHLAKVNGFRLAGEYSTFKSALNNCDPGNRNPFSPIEIDEEQLLLNWLLSTNPKRLPFGLMDLGWQFAPPHLDYLDEYVGEKKGWWWHQQHGVVIMVEKIDGEETWGRVRMIASKTENLVEILTDLHLLADRLGYAGITWLAPLVPGIEGITAQAGYIRDWDSSLLVYEKSSTR